jgi:hypothetical protein
MATAPLTNATVVGTYTSGAWQTSLVNSATAVGQVPFSTNGTTFTPIEKIVRGTAVASTSGASIDFTGIPSWVKRITVMFDVVSQTTATSPAFLFQLGTSGGIVATGYVSQGSTNGGSNTASTTGFNVRGPSGANALMTGAITINNITSNTWVQTNFFIDSTNTQYNSGGGKIALGGTLTQLRIAANGGAFNAGTINILYE